jgi:hypothetical protein
VKFKKLSYAAVPEKQAHIKTNFDLYAFHASCSEARSLSAHFWWAFKLQKDNK